MADGTEERRSYPGIILAGVISLIVGVASGWLSNVVTRDRLALSYEMSPSAVFEGEAHRIAIVGLRVSNTGTKEVEEVQCKLGVTGGVIQESRDSGLPAGAVEVESSSNSLTVTLPFLNPGESFSIQVLVQPSTIADPVATVQLRGKGIIGEQTTATADTTDRPDKKEVGALAMAALASTLAAMAILTRKRRPGLPLDQRGVLAFFLELNGFHKDAEVLRRLPTEQSYWSLSDWICASALKSDDPDVARRALATLEQLAQLRKERIAPFSLAIIKTNMARLALRVGDAARAKKELESAVKHRDQIVQERISLFPELSALLPAKPDSATG